MPLVFVSHAAADNVIAAEFRNHLIGDFLGMCEVFVSSNLDSIAAGKEWHQVIKSNLLAADIVVGLLSPIAVTRGWVYTEFGAGWIREVPTIPLCHSGLTPDQLPAPLNSFQGLALTDAVHLEHLYALVSRSVGCKPPQIDFKTRAQAYHQATTAIQLERGVLGWLQHLNSWNPEMIAKLRSGETDTDVLVPSHADPAMMAFAADAQALGLCSVTASGMAIGTRVGTSASVYHVVPGVNLGTYLAMLQL
jgi:hypothetical protein